MTKPGKAPAMRFLVLGCDYDGTLAADGRVSGETIDALERLKAAGRRLLLISGRELEDLETVFSRFDLFDWMVVENGAVLYQPSTKKVRHLAEPPPERFAAELRRRGVSPLSVGHVIVATWEPHEGAVLKVIRDQALELEIVFNKGAVMVLPTGVNKAAGLAAALREMGLSARNVVGVGDAENDLAFLSSCECSVAVSNALPSVKEACDHVTQGDHGRGVRELIEQILDDDLASFEPKLTRHHLPLGTTVESDAGEAQAMTIPPARVAILATGPAGTGRSALATGLLERIHHAGYQFCLVDAGGEHRALPGRIVLGAADRPPGVDEVLGVLSGAEESVVVNLAGLLAEDRAGFLDALLPRLRDLRALTGRPHWVAMDQGSHPPPGPGRRAAAAVPPELDTLLLMSVRPDLVAVEVLSRIDLMLATGRDVPSTVEAFARRAGHPLPAGLPEMLGGEEALAWWPKRARPPRVISLVQPGAPKNKGANPKARSLHRSTPSGLAARFREATPEP